MGRRKLNEAFCLLLVIPAAIPLPAYANAQIETTFRDKFDSYFAEGNCQ